MKNNISAPYSPQELEAIQSKIDKKMMNKQYDDELIELLEKTCGKEMAQNYKEIYSKGYTENVMVNFPRTKENFETGNGEGCWVHITESTKKSYDKDYTGGEFEGYIGNRCCYYPDLKIHSLIKFTMQGKKRPVALIEGFLENYRAITDEMWNVLDEMAKTRKYTDDEIADKMLELFNT